MIYIFRDLSKVDPAILAKAKAATEGLAKLTDPQERKDYIAQNDAIWTAFRPALRAMSHDKCWYSEAKETVSRYDVDHFRPKGAARISLTESSEGYSWLAFEPTNYVLAGQLCNQANREYSDTTVGKANWFPLHDPSKAASLAKPDCSGEHPIILNPTDEESIGLLEFGEDGVVHPRSDLDQDFKEAVDWAIELLGIRQTALNEARRTLWQRCHVAARQYKRIALKAPHTRTAGEVETMKELVADFVRFTTCDAPFSALARTALRSQKLDHFVRPDEYPEGMQAA